MKHILISIFSYGGFTTVEMYKDSYHSITGGESKSFPVKLIVQCCFKLLKKIWRKEK